MQSGTKPEDINHSKMTEDQRKQYLKRLYKLASDHYTPEEKEAYLNKLYAEQADATMIRAAAMQVYRARKAKERHDYHKELSPTSVTTPLETKTPMTALKDRVFQLFSCADLQVVDDNGHAVANEEEALSWLDKFIREFENDIVQKHFTVPRDKESSSSQQNIDKDIKPRKDKHRMRVDKSVSKYDASNLDNYLESNNVNDDKGFSSLDFGDLDNDGDDEDDAALMSAMKRTHINQNKKVTSRELFFNEGPNEEIAAPHTIYISHEDVKNEEVPATTVSTAKLDTKKGTKTIVIVPTSPSHRKSKTKKTNKNHQHLSNEDHDIPFDERNKIKSDRMNHLVESVKNLPFDEASFTIAFNAEEFVDHLANESATNDDFLLLDYDTEASQRNGLTVEELALDVEYQYR